MNVNSIKIGIESDYNDNSNIIKWHLRDSNKILAKPSTDSLDYYELIEASSYMLSAIIGYASTAQAKEEKSLFPNKEKIIYLEKLYNEVYEINKDGTNFQNEEKMKDIIEKYFTVLRYFQI